MCDRCSDSKHEINTCYLQYGESALLHGKCANCKKTPKEILKEQTIESLEWMIAQYQWQYDSERVALQDEGSQGGYSPRLTKAMSLLIRLKEQE